MTGPDAVVQRGNKLVQRWGLWVFSHVLCCISKSICKKFFFFLILISLSCSFGDAESTMAPSGTGLSLPVLLHPTGDRQAGVCVSYKSYCNPNPLWMRAEKWAVVTEGICENKRKMGGIRYEHGSGTGMFADCDHPLKIFSYWPRTL